MFHHFTPKTEEEEVLEKIQELKDKNFVLDEKYEKLLEVLGVKPEELKAYITNPDNFSKPYWEALQEERELQELPLRHDLASLQKQKKKSEDKNITAHWIYVR